MNLGIISAQDFNFLIARAGASMGLDHVELVMELEDHFGISIADKDAEKLLTVGMTAKYIAEKLVNQPSLEKQLIVNDKGLLTGIFRPKAVEKGHTTPGRRADGSVDEALVFEEVKLVVSKQMKVRAETLTQDTRYIQDLGMG